jgi:ADP-ribosylglycohydrolase/Inositol monophosphatase family
MTDHDYIDVLDIAIGAAIMAGEILRADFLQPGGPRGEGEHADADDEAEALIRAHLLEATPNWSYRGEETGFRAGTEGRHTWLVDPNDATSAFEEGVVSTDMGGGDTDTNAAIAGALLGAIHGAPAVPRQWQEAVLTCRPQAGVAGVRQPRPRAFWPVDALILSERLAALGRKPA